MNKFSERLKEVLRERDMSQVALAKKIGMSQGVVNNYCTGKREPTLDVLVSICRALNESADYLLGLEDWWNKEGVRASFFVGYAHLWRMKNIMLMFHEVNNGYYR